MLVPGRVSTVARIVPSAKLATLFATCPAGIGTQPRQASVGLSPSVRTSNTSIDSRPPWFTTSSRQRSRASLRNDRPRALNSVGSSAPGQSGQARRSGAICAGVPLNHRASVRVRVSTSFKPAPAAKPLATSHGVSAIRSTSSGFAARHT